MFNVGPGGGIDDRIFHLSNMVVVALLIFLLVLGHQTQTSFALLGEDVYLLLFKNALQNASALDATWRNGTHPCHDRWMGVECKEHGRNNISGIVLINLGLSGGIDIDSLSMLPTLRILSLERNSFTGVLPAFNRLTSLRSLYLSRNDLSGQIPQDYFSNMKSLKRLDLSWNNFVGLIPSSVQDMQQIERLILSNNGFTGLVPSIAQKSLQQFNVSNNNLVGEIPIDMIRFGALSYSGNPALCGSTINKECEASVSTNNNTSPSPPVPSAPVESDDQTSSNAKWVILGIVVVGLAVTIFLSKSSSSKKKSDESLNVRKENLDEVVQMKIQKKNSQHSKKSLGNSSSNYTMANESSVGSHSRRGSGSSRGHSSSDLVMINEEKGVFRMQDLMKAAAEVIGGEGMGSAYKAIMSNGVSVVVKRFRDMNKLNKDAFDTEVRRLGRIRHRNILPPLAYHYRKDEKLLVTEFVPKGCLMFVLHGDRGIAHAELNWAVRLKIIKGVARGMGYLHTEFANYELPHGNLKSSNILLSTGYEPVLTDYALYSLLSNSHSVQALFSYKCPEAVQYQQLSPKSDVYCLGIVILEIMTGKYPSQYMNNQNSGTDVVQWVTQAISENRVAELIDPEIAGTLDSFHQLEKMLNIAAICVESDPDQRIEMREAIRSIEDVQVV